MCEFHDCNCNGLGDIWWADKCMYFRSIDRWRSSGKPRQGEEFESKRLTKLQFKYALHYVKQHDNIMRKDSLAKKLAMSDPTNSGRKSA